MIMCIYNKFIYIFILKVTAFCLFYIDCSMVACLPWWKSEVGQALRNGYGKGPFRSRMVSIDYKMDGEVAQREDTM